MSPDVIYNICAVLLDCRNIYYSVSYKIFALAKLFSYDVIRAADSMLDPFLSICPEARVGKHSFTKLIHIYYFKFKNIKYYYCCLIT